jgi:5-methylcytosine-specific restriction endonuclease McrA
VANILHSTAWLAVRLVVLDRDRHRCQVCLPGCRGRADAVDHIVARCEGGTSTPENLRAICRHCNSTLGARLTNQRRRDRQVGRRSRRW